MIARITVPRAQAAAVLMRATGLRIEQVSCIRGADIDPVENTLVIAKCKSRREKTLMRTVAIPAWLVPTLRALGAWREGLLLQHMDHYGGVCDAPMPSPRNLAQHCKSEWERAAKDGAARAGIWAPGNRVTASTMHALRAEYPTTIEEARVREAVIDWLVGHAGRSIRATGYTKPRLAAMRAAVENASPVAGLAGEAG